MQLKIRILILSLMTIAFTHPLIALNESDLKKTLQKIVLLKSVFAHAYTAASKVAVRKGPADSASWIAGLAFNVPLLPEGISKAVYPLTGAPDNQIKIDDELIKNAALFADFESNGSSTGIAIFSWIYILNHYSEIENYALENIWKDCIVVSRDRLKQIILKMLKPDKYFSDVLSSIQKFYQHSLFSILEKTNLIRDEDIKKSMAEFVNKYGDVEQCMKSPKAKTKSKKKIYGVRRKKIRHPLLPHQRALEVLQATSLTYFAQLIEPNEADTGPSEEKTMAEGLIPPDVTHPIIPLCANSEADIFSDLPELVPHLE